jgi:hypothetical protein
MDFRLVLIFSLVLLLIIYIFFDPRVERFLTGSPSVGSYLLSWTAPSNNGGDSSCCSYAYQVCLASDTNCTSPVLKGTTSSTSFTFPSPSWNNSYVAMVQAINSVGGGPWSSVSFETGNGTLSAAVFGQQLSSSGQVQVPLNTSSTQAMIYVGMTGVESADAVAIQVTQESANGGIVGQWTPTPSIASDYSSLMVTLPSMTFSMGDVLSISVLVMDGTTPVADGIFSTTISATIPGAVQGLAVVYQPPGSVCSVNTDCGMEGMVCDRGVCVPQCMQWYASSQPPQFTPIGAVEVQGQMVAPVLAPNPNGPGGVWGGLTPISSGSLSIGTVYGPPIGDESSEVWAPSTIYYLTTVAGCESMGPLSPASVVEDALTFSGVPVCFNFSSTVPCFLQNQGSCASFGSLGYGTFQLVNLQ